MPTFKFLKIKEYEAVGGPANAVTGKDGHMKTSTVAGRYVVHSISKHVSYGKYAFYSGVAWGTLLQIQNGKIQIKPQRQWINLTSLPAFKKYTDESIIDALSQAYSQLKQTFNNTPGVLTTVEKKAALPDSWIFNDFGHVSVKYFKDLNNDYILNGKERVMGDFIHTTPDDEFLVSHKYKKPLGESHGCIHVNPSNVDTFIQQEYVKKGSVVEVKSYTDSGPIPISFESTAGRPYYELHFYPSLKQIVIYSVRAI